jgi:protein HOOK3
LSFPGKLPEEPGTDQWIPRWNNLKHINDALTMFLAEDCGQKLPLPSGVPDLKAIAQNGSLHDTVALLKLIVVAAINCNDRIEFLTQMQDLDTNTQEVLMRTAQEASESEDIPDEEPQKPAEEPEVVSSPVARSPRVDDGFAAEERLGRVLADNQRIAHEKRDIERQLDEAYARYDRLQESLDKSQDELKETNDRLTAVLAGRAEGTNRDAKNETIIAQLEARVSAADNEVEELRKSNEMLKIKVEKTQKLQDDYDEIKIERDKLARKANAADKYKQKLEASQDLEKENANLKERITELQGQVRHSDSTTVAKSDLQRENEELKKLFSVIEQDYNETATMKKQLEFDYQTLEARFHDRGEDLRRHQQMVEDLQGQIQDYDEDGPPPAVAVSDTAKALEDAELEDDKAEKPVDDTSETEDRLGEAFSARESRLTAALLNGGAEKGEEGISEDELKAIMSAMRAQAQAGSANEKESSMKAQKKLILAVERSRNRNKELTEHIQKQSDLIQSLKTRADAAASTVPAEDRPPTPPPKDEEPRAASPTPSEAERDIEAAGRVIKNLRRELDLVTSAWYEQNRRIASSGMATLRNRASPEPKSFLGRQRKTVEAIALGGAIR